MQRRYSLNSFTIQTIQTRQYKVSSYPLNFSILCLILLDNRNGDNVWHLSKIHAHIRVYSWLIIRLQFMSLNRAIQKLQTLVVLFYIIKFWFNSFNHRLLKYTIYNSYIFDIIKQGKIIPSTGFNTIFSYCGYDKIVGYVLSRVSNKITITLLSITTCTSLAAYLQLPSLKEIMDSRPGSYSFICVKCCQQPPPQKKKTPHRNLR